MPHTKMHAYRATSTYWFLGMIGVLLFAVGVYTQWVSMELETHTVSDYLISDITTPDWWRSVGSAILGGLGYIFVAGFGCAVSSSRRTCLGMTMGLLLLSSALAFFSSAWIIAAVLTGLAVADCLFRLRKE
jgi:general stress protein CsbA